MKLAGHCLLFFALVFNGCETAHTVAVSSFHVIDAPAHFVRRKIDESDNPRTASAHSDVTNPGQPVAPSPTPARHLSTERSAPSSTVAHSSPTPQKSSPKSSTATQRIAASTAPQIPTAKAVPNKPGYVFSPFDPSGGYVDVSGYAPGSKVKDPYSGKVFLVP